MMINPNFKKVFFSEMNLIDPFFDSLREDYIGFDQWFNRKKNLNEYLYTTYCKDNKLTGVLYLKIENEEYNNITPILTRKNRLKIGTFKINAHGTKLGEFYISKILHEAIDNQIDEIYVTIFEKHEGLIKLLTKYGFDLHGVKQTDSGSENVYIKYLTKNHNNIIKNYPKIVKNTNKYLLGINPEWHTRLFRDSILKTENSLIIKDISHTNSIHKAYICKMKGIDQLRQGDILVIYRTAEEGKIAYYSSVATSICVVGEYKNMYTYKKEDMIKDIERYSVFTKDELDDFYEKGIFPHIIKMLYNIALPKRIIQKDLIEQCNIPRDEYWGFIKLTDKQFDFILELGEVNENFVIN